MTTEKGKKKVSTTMMIELRCVEARENLLIVMLPVQKMEVDEEKMKSERVWEDEEETRRKENCEKDGGGKRRKK